MLIKKCCKSSHNKRLLYGFPTQQTTIGHIYFA